MHVTATAYDRLEQKIVEVTFEGFAEITSADLVTEALHRLLQIVPGRPFMRIEIALR